MVELERDLVPEHGLEHTERGLLPLHSYDREDHGDTGLHCLMSRIQSLSIYQFPMSLNFLGGMQTCHMASKHLSRTCSMHEILHVGDGIRLKIWRTNASLTSTALHLPQEFYQEKNHTVPGV